jgi:acyl-coenzyme A synthetase/AMP-(fatty) acid ligase
MAKILDAARKTVWHRMGDVGYLDQRGRLWFCGRKSQRVATSTGTLFTIPCEAVFNTHSGVFRSALVGVLANGEMKPVLCVETERSCRQPWSAIVTGLRQLAQRFPHTQPIAAFLWHPAFPIDIRHNAKIFREKLATWATRRLKDYGWPPPQALAPPPTFDEQFQPTGSQRR